LFPQNSVSTLEKKDFEFVKAIDSNVNVFFPPLIAEWKSPTRSRVP
jgi:hypothetical protein